MTSAGKSGRWRQRHRDDVDLRMPVAARLDGNLSRLRVVAKCLLALRLHIVLASPGLTFVVLTVAVLFPTLPTARSPRCTLDFNVRVRCHYAYGRPRNRSVSTVSAPECVRPPADLDGDRRDRLSGAALTKRWLLAIPPAKIIGGPSSRTRAGSQPLRRL
jgi:hypothetical protein